ncbi:MAG: MBL fold metallo-hydrolase [Thermoproteota archaeon]
MVEVEILGGKQSIGGNFVRIKEGDKVIVFDQGIRFDIMDRFYTNFITPRSISELRNLGVLPLSAWYEDVEDIYVTHLHLDHLGALANIPKKANVHLPSKEIYELMEETWKNSPTWLSLIPRKYFIEVIETEPYTTDRNSVMPLPVSHSAFPSCAYLYFGKKETVLYTGDFRVEGFLTEEEFHKFNQGEPMLEYLENNHDIKVDRLIIEGTNIGSSRLPLSPEEEKKILEKIFQASKIILATVHSLDIEYAYTLAKLSQQYNFNFYLTVNQTSKLLEKVKGLPVEPKTIVGHVDTITSFESIDLSEIEGRSVIITTYRNVVDLIKDLTITNIPLKDVIAIISEPEPQIEESTEYAVVSNWFTLAGIQSYIMRASGHYYTFQLKQILGTIKPKNIEIIHTERPSLFKKLIVS